jgi:miniconductance mechanosensitive channel
MSLVAAMGRQLEALRVVLAPYPGTYSTTALLLLLVLAWLANWITQRLLLRLLHLLLIRLASMWRDESDRPLHLTMIPRLANVVPALVIEYGLALVPELPARLVALLQGGCRLFIVATVTLALSYTLDLLNEIYERRPDARNRPIKGFLQVIKIIAFLLAGLSVIATLVGVSVGHIVTGLGAIMAVLILVFQDTLLSLVASVQISSDGRVRVGDWVEMPDQHADGMVTDIALHTVTVQNWDNTISTIPTKKLISESFKNWRGMYESGGRRIKRSLLLDQHSVRFLADEEIQRLQRFTALQAHMLRVQAEQQAWDAQFDAHAITPLQAPRPSNLGMFRSYVEHYLRLNPHIRQDMLLMVRQLQPGANGLPLEIWCFGRDTGIVGYEQAQADIFDHLLALLPEFDLRVFQVSSDSMLARADAQQQLQRNRILASITG